MREVVATSYRVEICADEDWGLHKADSGYMIRVYPEFEGAVYDSRPITRGFLTAEAHKLWGDHASWLDLEEACEDVDGEEGNPVVEAHNRAMLLYRTQYEGIEIHLSTKQVEEIKAAHPGHRFDTFRRATLKR